MVPRWVKALIVVELAGIVALVVVGAHLALDGVHAAGDIISWARPAAPAAGSRPPLAPAPVPPPPRSPAGPATAALPPGLGGSLNGSTAGVITGQIGIVAEIQEALRRYIEARLQAIAGGR